MDITLLDAALALIFARAAGTAVQWMGRPAAGVEFPYISSARAIAEICVALAAAATKGANGLLLLVLCGLVLRAVLELSYRAWGGIRPLSLWWARGLAGIGTLLIAGLPESIR